MGVITPGTVTGAIFIPKEMVLSLQLWLMPRKSKMNPVAMRTACWALIPIRHLV
jgi:hypothetical protein